MVESCGVLLFIFDLIVTIPFLLSNSILKSLHFAEDIFRMPVK